MLSNLARVASRSLLVVATSVFTPPTSVFTLSDFAADLADLLLLFLRETRFSSLLLPLKFRGSRNKLFLG